MKIDKLHLTKIFDAAKANFLDDDQCDLDSQQFVAKCYVKAMASILQIDIDLASRIFVEPVD